MFVPGAVRRFGACQGLVIAAAAVVAWGCGARSLGNPPPDPPPDPAPDPIPRSSHYLASNRNVDLLFLIDDSSSMRLSQDNLLRNFPVLMNAIENLPGGLPNIHIGVISSDMGAGDGSIAGCHATDGSGGPGGSGMGGAGGGFGASNLFELKNGVFQYAARGTCTVTGLAPGATFISNIGGVANYTGNLADVFTCIAALGESGCGFERPFAAITRALGVDGRPAPLENQGFLRPDAYLAIVLITNEDDCSAHPGVALYDVVNNSNLASPLGPPSNFRCNEFGHLCGGARPNRHAPNNSTADTVSYADCTSNDADEFLLSVRETADRLKALKADDGQVMVAAIAGPSSPYTVTWREPSFPDTSCGAASCPWPVIGHACTGADGNFADPAIRINELVGAFGANGLSLSICAGDYSPALASIAGDIVQYVNQPCIRGTVALQPGTTRADCTVTDNATGTSIPSCADTGGTGPCWHLETRAGQTCTGVAVQSDPAGPEAAQDTTVDCTLCVPGVPDPARGCP
jgi:hypothetical protein